MKDRQIWQWSQAPCVSKRRYRSGLLVSGILVVAFGPAVTLAQTKQQLEEQYRQVCSNPEMRSDPTMVAMCAQLQGLIDQVDESRLKSVQPSSPATSTARAPAGGTQSTADRQAIAEVEQWYVRISREISECDRRLSTSAAKCRDLRKRFESEYPRMMGRTPPGYELPPYATLNSRHGGSAGFRPPAGSAGVAVTPPLSQPGQAAVPGARSSASAQYVNPQTGEPCVTAAKLEDQWATTLPGPGCLRRTEWNSCRDRVIQVELKNGCSSQYIVSWQFEGAGRRCAGSDILGSGRSQVIGCRQGENGASGGMDFEFRPY